MLYDWFPLELPILNCINFIALEWTWNLKKFEQRLKNQHFLFYSFFPFWLFEPFQASLLHTYGPEASWMRRSDFIIAPYLLRSNARAFWQLLTTIVPVLGLWLIVPIIDQTSFSKELKVLAFLPVLGLLALFSSRAFSLMHDCGHGSLFRSRWLNRSMGFLLGVLNAIPQDPWSRDHAFHHRHNGNWEIYRGPIDVLSVEDYQALSKRGKLF